MAVAQKECQEWVVTVTRDTATSRPDEATMVAEVGLATLRGGATRKGKVAAMTVEKNGSRRRD
jgi:hypothetical protein